MEDKYFNRFDFDKSFKNKILDHIYKLFEPMGEKYLLYLKVNNIAFYSLQKVQIK